MAFLTILTRSFRRPESLGRCVKSVALQTDPDVEHVIIHDQIGRGVEWSYTNLRSVTPDGEYVMLLDDDDYLIEPSFVAELKCVTQEQGSPDVVFVGMNVAGTVMPIWEHGLRRGYIACSCFVIRRDVWLEHAQDFRPDYSADFYFIESIMNCDKKHTAAHLDMVASQTGRVSHGQPENISITA
jgi:glycosyltransferase involved in cell wall biosynthesis